MGRAAEPCTILSLIESGVEQYESNLMTCNFLAEKKLIQVIILSALM